MLALAVAALLQAQPTPGSIALHWRRRPDAEDFMRAFPRRAIREGVNGRTVLHCTINDDGRLRDCTVEESPAGYGFGDAALRLSRSYQAETEGMPPLGGSVITIPLNWVAPD